uniref:Uncharacterized protein n=1 Tax=Panagrolaimus sp. PS1159 TaxID=55785 RepID=A0AC35FYV0_9BILA
MTVSSTCFPIKTALLDYIIHIQLINTRAKEKGDQNEHEKVIKRSFYTKLGETLSNIMSSLNNAREKERETNNKKKGN